VTFARAGRAKPARGQDVSAMARATSLTLPSSGSCPTQTIFLHYMQFLALRGGRDITVTPTHGRQPRGDRGASTPIARSLLRERHTRRGRLRTCRSSSSAPGHQRPLTPARRCARPCSSADERVNGPRPRSTRSSTQPTSRVHTAELLARVEDICVARRRVGPVRVGMLRFFHRG